jgi:hypothetical protein
MRLLPTILFVLFARCLAAQLRLPVNDCMNNLHYPTFSHYPAEILKGKIRHIAYYDLEIPMDSIKLGFNFRFPPGDIFGMGAWFDEHGNMTRETMVDDGEEEIFREYSYDSQQRLVLVKRLDRWSGAAEDSIIYDDEKNSITRYQDMCFRGDTTFIRYRFDKTGNLISLAKKFPIGINGMNYETTYEYDSKKRVIREVTKHFPYVRKTNAAAGGTKVNSQDTLIHDYFENGDVETERIYKQTKGKRELKKENIFYVTKRTKVTGEYYSAGTRAGADSVVTTDTGTISYSLKYNEQFIREITQFDERGRKTAIFYTEPDDKEVFQYELDKMGNWIVLRRFVNGKLYTTRRRIIEYFE